MKRPKWLGTNP